MAVDIDTVTIGGVEDRRLCLSNATAARKLSVGSSWNRIRIAARIAHDDTGANITGTPRLWFGLLNNPSASVANGPMGGSTSHFVGIRSKTATWTRAAGPPVNYSVGTCWEAIKRVGTTNTTSAFTGTCAFVAVPNTYRWPIFVEIIKGSPNFTIRCMFWNQAVTATDFTIENLRRCLEGRTLENCRTQINASPTTNKYLIPTDQTIAVDEGTDGSLNSVCIAWDQSGSILRVSDIQFFVVESA